MMFRGLGLRLLLLSMLAARCAVNAGDECSPCKKTTDHTLCKYPTEDQGGDCKGSVDDSYRLSQEDKDKVLAKHNALRASLTEGKVPCQPTALNMKTLTWSNDLEKLAKRWNIQCITDPPHDTCRDNDKGYVGQNTHTFWDTSGFGNTLPDKLMASVQWWFDEVKHFPAKNVAKYANPPGPETRHYTTLVWADTTQIGCDRTFFVDDHGKNIRLVCNYATGGNTDDAAVYQTKEGDLGNGTDCSAAVNVRLVWTSPAFCLCFVLGLITRNVLL